MAAAVDWGRAFAEGAKAPAKPSVVTDQETFGRRLTFADPQQLDTLLQQLRSDPQASALLDQEMRRRAGGGQQAQVLKPLATMDQPGGLGAADMVNPPPGGHFMQASADGAWPPFPIGPAAPPPSPPATPSPGVGLAADALSLRKPAPQTAGMGLAPDALALRKPAAPVMAASLPRMTLAAAPPPRRASPAAESESDRLNREELAKILARKAQPGSVRGA